MTLTILKPGVLSTIQDWGRFHYQHLGFSVGGPMDEHAFLWAHKLLNNNPRHNVVEINLGGFSCRFEQDTTIALCGADMQMQINEMAVGNWCSLQVKTGDVLTSAFATVGMRSYLAIEGGFLLDKQLGSNATVLRERIGGIDGTALKAGDELLYAPGQIQQTVRVPTQFIPSYADDMSVGVIPAYQYEQFSEADRERFFDATYIVGNDSNRMGLRLDGPAIQVQQSLALSEPIAFGAIQIPPNGQPIILAKDRQNIGGYPKLGTVSTLDMSALGQAKPGTRIHFYETNVDQHAEKLRQRHQFFRL